MIQPSLRSLSLFPFLPPYPPIIQGNQLMGEENFKTQIFKLKSDS